MSSYELPRRSNMAILDHSPVFVASASLICLVSYYFYAVKDWEERSRGRPLPPGPHRLPIVGNLFNAPTAKPWYGYRDLCAQYGKYDF